jgi:hypothetical protein
MEPRLLVRHPTVVLRLTAVSAGEWHSFWFFLGGGEGKSLEEISDKIPLQTMTVKHFSRINV